MTTVGEPIVFLVIATALVHFAETNSQPEEFSIVPAAMYRSVVTLTTVACDGTVPITPIGCVLAVTIAVLAIGLCALPARILSDRLRGADVGTRAALAHGGSTGDQRLRPHCGQPLPDSSAD